MDLRNDGSEMDRLMELMKLYEAGLISKEEMEDYKRKIVGNLPQHDEGDFQNDPPEPLEDFSKEESEADANISIENSVPETQESTNGGKPRSKSKLVIIGIVIALIVAGIGVVSNLPSKSEKIYKVRNNYEAKGYKILAFSGSSTNAPFIVYQDGNEIYIDEFEKKQQPRKLFPAEGGFYYKEIETGFEQGKPVVNTNMLFEGERRNFDCGNKNLTFNEVESYEKSKIILNFRSESDNGIINYIYCFSNPNTIFVYYDNLDVWRDGLTLKFTLGFDDIYGKTYNRGGYSLSDYPIEIPFQFSREDMSFIGLGEHLYGPIDQYPYEQIQNKTDYSGLVQYGGKIGIPTSWLGTPLMDSVAYCLADDISSKFKNDFLDNTVAFGDMVEMFRSNPVKANQLYHEGEAMYLSAYVDKISYTSSGNYKYLLETENIADFNIYITTNDESFVKLNYPARVWIKAIYKGHYNLNDSFVGAVVEFFFMDDVGDRYSFEDAELYYYKEEY